jgi:multicomponent Na+:H+ antiporter subunit F
VALDFLTVALVSFCGLLALRTGVQALLDAALVLALVGFLATVAFARFAERGVGLPEEREEDP